MGLGDEARWEQHVANREYMTGSPWGDEVHMDIPADEDYMQPCQPIGCDNGYHLAGCAFNTDV